MYVNDIHYSNHATENEAIQIGFDAAQCIVFPLGHRSNYTTKQFLLIKAYMYYNFLRLDEPNLFKVILVGYLSDTKRVKLMQNQEYNW